MPPALLISLRFPAGVYRGADLGQPEVLPSPARLHAAFVGAAGGGPDAKPDGETLTADPSDQDAVRWIEETEPLGALVPEARLTTYDAVRHRIRVAVDPKERHDHHRNETPFEPFSALKGAIVFAWPRPEPAIRERLERLAHEITHVGQADSIVVVNVSEGEFDPAVPGAFGLIDGRGVGIEMRVAEPGRAGALVGSHREALKRGPGRHVPGTKGKQAGDERSPNVGHAATRLRRFAQATPDGPWPFSEVWIVPVTPSLPRLAWRPEMRVRTAVRIHRSLIAQIGDNVPEFVTGRSGERPLAGAGHLSIQLVKLAADASPVIALGIPVKTPEADRATLLSALTARPVLRVGSASGGKGGCVVRLDEPSRILSGIAFWPSPARTLVTATPLVLDTPGVPRRGRWTLDDAVLCSLGYALRGTLEERGLAWANGWEFRREMVATLRRLGADARAFRVAARADRFVHHSREGDLLVAVDAIVQLGELACGGRGLLALGRARHLGGGLLVPVEGDA